MDEKKLIEIQNRLIEDKPVIGLEVTTQCNKFCYMCPRKNFKRKNKNMSKETFQHLLDWAPEPCDFFIAGYGEPLMNPDLAYFVNGLSKKGEVSVMTNGILLTAERMKELFDNGLDRLQVSILLKDGIEQVDKYVAMTIPEYVEKVEFNILYEENMTLPQDKVDEYNAMGFKARFKLIHNRGGELYAAKWTDEIKSCGSFFILGDIDSDGNLKVCSQDINGVHNFGNVATTTFEQYKDFKRKFLGNRGIIPQCEQCTDEYRLIHLHNYDEC